MHYGASESGTIFSVSDSASAETLNSTNAKVTGSFTAGVTNYIGLDLIRSADSTTSDSVQFLDANSNLEIAQTVPLARTLQYKIVISTQNFTVSSNICPIAKVVTTATNTITSIQDARKMMFRLGTGGDNPNATATYTWGTRTESPITYSGGTDPFTGEDKSINNLKSWIDAVMTSIWDVKGGERWYSPVNQHNLKICYGPVGTLADNWVFDPIPNPDLLKWEALSVAFENAESTGVYFNTIADNIAGVSFDTDGLCLYVDIQRESNATNIPAVVGTLQTLGTPTIPGRRFILAWRRNGTIFVRDRAYEVGRALQVASTTVIGVVKLSRAATTPTAPIVISDSGGTITPGANVGLVVSAPSSGNNNGITTTGKGTASGINATGGDSNGKGVVALGIGSGAGVAGTGGVTDGSSGVTGTSSATNGIGVTGTGTGTNTGVKGIGGSTNGSSGVTGTTIATNGTGVTGTGSGTGAGVTGVGTGAGIGVTGTGGNTNGSSGVTGTTIATNGNGVTGTGSGTGVGIEGLGANGASGTGVKGTGGSANGKGAEFFGAGTGYGVEITGGPTAGPAIHAIIGGGGNTGPVIVADGSINFNAAGTPASTADVHNQLTKANVVKAWARILADGGGGHIVECGQHIASTSISGNTTLLVNFASSFSNTSADSGFDYAATASDNYSGNYAVRVTNVSATQVAIQCFNGTVLNDFNSSGISHVLTLHVTGLQ